MNNTAVKIKKLDCLAITSLTRENLEAFATLKKYASTFGFSDVESGPFVRSSYRAEQIFKLVVN